MQSHQIIIPGITLFPGSARTSEVINQDSGPRRAIEALFTSWAIRPTERPDATQVSESIQVENGYYDNTSTLNYQGTSFCSLDLKTDYAIFTAAARLQT